MKQILTKNEVISLANKKFKENKLEEAVHYYQKIHEKYPYDKFITKKVSKLRNMISTQNNASNKTQIINEFTNLFNKKKYNEIIKKFKLQKFFYNHVVLNIVATSYKELRLYDQAIKLYSDSIKIKNDFWPSLFNRGLVFYEIGHFQKSYNDFEKAYKIQSNNNQIVFSLGSALEQLKDINNAKIYYETTIKLDSNFEPAYLSLADLQVKLNMFDDALITLENLLKLNSKKIEQTESC